MPSLTNINILGHMKFASHQLKLPTDASWTPPATDQDKAQWKDSLEITQSTSATPSLIPALMSPQESNKFFQESADTIGKIYKDFHDTMLDAVKYAHDMWKLQAKFKDLQIMAVAAIGSPGCLDGPDLECLIKNAPMCASMQGNEAKWRDAVAKGVAKCFKDWQDQVTVPGLPWYPAFAAFPGPQAPPMPNVPTPLAACVSSKMTSITMPDAMKDEMCKALDSELKDNDPDKQHEALFDALATVLSTAFLMWLPQQQVNLVLGKGPIPTFAPPFVPVGPVVAGDNLPIPGHLMS